MPISVGLDTNMSLQWEVGSRAQQGSMAAQMPTSIGVYGFYDGPDAAMVFGNQPMYYWAGDGAPFPKELYNIDVWPEENRWPYRPVKRWTPKCNYRFYAYSPYEGSGLDVIGLYSQSFVGISKFTRYKIPPVSAEDYTVANRVVEVESGTEPIFHMVHLTSRLRFCFALGEQYSQLRDIYVRSISISDVPIGVTNYYECEVALTDAGGLKDEVDITVRPSASDPYTPNGDGIIELKAENDSGEEGRPGLKLPCHTDGGFLPFSSAYNAYDGLGNTTLTVVYDVYDKKGQLLRQGQKVSNVVSLTSLHPFERGKCYDVRLLISPKFLYVLSDNDAKPTGIIDIPFE